VWWGGGGGLFGRGGGAREVLFGVGSGFCFLVVGGVGQSSDLRIQERRHGELSHSIRCTYDSRAPKKGEKKLKKANDNYLQTTTREGPSSRLTDRGRRVLAAKKKKKKRVRPLSVFLLLG